MIVTVCLTNALLIDLYLTQIIVKYVNLELLHCEKYNRYSHARIFSACIKKYMAVFVVNQNKKEVVLCTWCLVCVVCTISSKINYYSRTMYGYILFSLAITGRYAATTEGCHGFIDPELINVHTLENVLQVFENVGSSSQCALLCLSEYFCSRIYFNAVDEVCQTYYTSLSSKSYTARPGGMFYEMNCNHGCPENLGYLSYTSLLPCYKMSTYKTTWNDARAACIYELGDLIKLNSSQKDALMKNQLSGSDSYHVGGSDEAKEGSWELVDGESFSGGYTGWGISEPDSSGTLPQNCMMLAASKEFGWADVQCTRIERFICEIEI